jgi:ABC-2 type transport system ATP-binding protein
MKTKYRSDEYCLETQQDTDLLKLIRRFPAMKQIGKNQLRFSEKSISSFEVLHFLSAEQIFLLKWERMEPTLESLFMEVTKG